MERANFRLLLCICTLSVFFSANSQNNNWITYSTSVTGDFIKGISGGVSNDFISIGMEELSLLINIEEMGLWNGGEIFLHGINSHGGSPSEEIAGDWQVFSNIEAGNYIGFYEYYICQSFGDFSITFGQHDLNSEFVGTEYGGTFINSSFGISPTLSLNIPVSIYPFAAPALILKYGKPGKLSYKFGVYDGDPGDPETSRYNLQPSISNQDGFLFIGEFELQRFINFLPENYKIGFYYHTNEFIDYSNPENFRRGNYGAYFVSDVVLLSSFKNPHQYLGVFLQGGISPQVINQCDYYLGGGLHFNGALPQMYDDAFGLAFAYAHLSKAYQQTPVDLLWGELALEFTYKFSIFEHYTIQPNFQYIIQPGANPTLKNALIGMLRFNISLD